MHIKTVIRCLSRLLITSFATLGVLQPLTLHAAPAGEVLTGDGRPNVVQVAVPHRSLVAAPTDVSIDDGGTVIVVKSSALLVRTVLAEEAIFIGEQDIVQPALDEQVGALRSIAVIRVTTQEVTRQSAVAFPTRIQQDPSRTNGVDAVQSQGVNGSVTTHSTVVLHNGAEVTRQVTGTEQVAPVEKVVLHGTKQADVSRGGASWYDGGPGTLTAAHRTLPFGTKVLVTNQANGLSIVVTIADRGPFIAGRIIDLSPDSFAKIAGLGSGVVQVSMTRL